MMSEVSGRYSRLLAAIPLRHPPRTAGIQPERPVRAFSQTNCVDIGTRREQGREEGDLRLWRRGDVHHAGLAVEDPRLRRPRWTRLHRRQLQQPQQPRILGPEPRDPVPELSDLPIQ